MRPDLEIQQDVMEELNANPQLKTAQIGVTVKNGIVTLTGTADSCITKEVAEDATRRVSGVKAIAEDIEIKISQADKKSDSELAQMVLNAFKWNKLIPEDKIKVKVEDGLVTLNGKVEWDYQRTAARNAVINLAGVKAVKNDITIASEHHPELSDAQVRSKIISAFHRSATLDAQKINVETHDHKITLSGVVRSWAEKEDAERAVWSLPGVVSVDNRLQIELKAV